MAEPTLDDLKTATPQASQATAYQGTAATADATQASAPSGFSAYTAEASRAGSRDAAAAAGSTRDASVGAAEAVGYNAQTGEIDPNTMTAAGQTTAITGQDSAYMRRAREAGQRTAARRGLGNSSIAAGASMGAAIDRAAPLAQQDAQTYFANMRANTDAANRASEVSTGRETEVNMQGADLASRAEMQNAAEANRMSALNAELATQVDLANSEAANRISELNAQLDTAVSQQNATEANRIQQQIADLENQVNIRNAELQTQVDLTNTEQQNAMRRLNAEMATNVDLANAEAQNQMQQQVLDANARLNEQYLAGTQAMDIEAIQGKYNQLISSNQAASNLYTSQIDAIATMMQNPEIKPDRVASYVRTITTQLENGLEFIDAINTIELGNPSEAVTSRTPAAPEPAPTPTPTPPPAGIVPPGINFPYYGGGGGYPNGGYVPNAYL